MKRSNKAIYKYIMTNISREVKRTLNEARNLSNTVNHEIFNAIENVALEYDMEITSPEFINILSAVIKQAKNMSKNIQTTVTKEAIGKIFINWILGNPYNMNYTTRGYIKFILSYNGGKPLKYYSDDVYDISSEVNEEINNAVHDELLKLDDETLISLIQTYPIIQSLLYNEISNKQDEYGINLEKNDIYFEFGGNYESLANLIYDILKGNEPSIEENSEVDDYPPYGESILTNILVGEIKD